VGQAGLASRRQRLILAAAFTAGTLFRVIPYVRRPSLWLDEARLALNLGSRSFAGLLRPLDYDQAAPPLFLWAEKLAMLAGGANEYALRALPLLAGLLVPVLTYLLARRLAGIRVATVAAVLTAISPALVYYSVQLKPYASDAVISLALLISFVLESDRRGRGWAPGPWTTVLGALAVWASTTAPFVLAAIALAWVAARRGSWRALVVALGCWAVSFGVAYRWVYRPVAENPYLHWFWGERMLSPWIPGFLGRAYDGVCDVVFTSFVAEVFEVGSSGLAAGCILAVTVIIGALMALGFARIKRSRVEVFILLAIPALAAVGASLVGAYPIAGRLMLFSVPLLVIAVAAGVAQLIAGPGRAAKVAVAVLLGPIVLAGQLRNVVRADDPSREGHLRPAVELLERALRPGEPVYVAAGALPAWTFYTTDWARPDTVRLARMAREGSSGGRAFENAPSRGRIVAGEGADLVFSFRDGVELLGTPDGAPVRAGHPRRGLPDSGWATSEALRMQHAAHPTVWFVSTTSFGTYRFVEQALQSLGGMVRDSLREPWVVVGLYLFPGGSAKR